MTHVRVSYAGMGNKNQLFTLRSMVTVLPALGLGYSAKKGTELPARVKILNWGENPNAHGKAVRVGRKLVEGLKARVCAYRQVALDYEHGTLPGTPEYNKTQEPRKVAGYGTVEVVEGDGVYLNMDYYTESGTENAMNYCDVSAGVCLDESGEVLTVHSVALCRNGAVDGMEFKEVALSVSVPCAAPQPTEDNMEKMDWKAIGKRLGLPETTAEADVKAAWEKWLKENPAPAAPPKAEDKGKDSTDAAKDGKKTAAMNAPEPEGVPAALSVEAMADELEKRQICKLAASQGKVVALSAEAVAAMKPADLETYVAGLGVTVPMKAKTPGSVPEVPAVGEPVGLSANDLKIYAVCGVEPPKPADGKKE